jgi:hypothetical protein
MPGRRGLCCPLSFLIFVARFRRQRAGAFHRPWSGAITLPAPKVLAAGDARPIPQPVTKTPATAQRCAVPRSDTKSSTSSERGAIPGTTAETATDDRFVDRLGTLSKTLTGSPFTAPTTWNSGSEIPTALFDLLEPGLFLLGECAGLPFGAEFLHLGLEHRDVVSTLFRSQCLACARRIAERAGRSGVLSQQSYSRSTEHGGGSDGFEHEFRFHIVFDVCLFCFDFGAIRIRAFYNNRPSPDERHAILRITKCSSTPCSQRSDCLDSNERQKQVRLELLSSSTSEPWCARTISRARLSPSPAP